MYERGDTLFVATSKPRELAVRVVEHFALAPFLLEVYGSEMDGRRSDKSALLRHLLTTEKLKPVDTVMVGDRRHDMRAATAAGLPAIGVLWGYGSRQELKRAGATALCTMPGDLPEAIASLARGPAKINVGAHKT
jgi:phosphoglycolate phosphatase